MTLLKFNPAFPVSSALFNNFFDRDIAPVSENFSSPAVNIKESDQAFSLELAIPGLKKEDFTIALEDDLLKVSSENKQAKKQKDEDANYMRKEFAYQSFNRTFVLPETADGEKLAATYENGVLQLYLPKKEEAKKKAPRLIEVA